MAAAYEFLESFDWPTYKEIRREQRALDVALSRIGRVKSRNGAL